MVLITSEEYKELIRIKTLYELKYGKDTRVEEPIGIKECKFKSGDKAEIISLNADTDNGFKVGDEVEILDTNNNNWYPIEIKNNNECIGYVKAEQLKLINEREEN